MWGSIGFGLSAWLSCIAASLFIGMITRGDNAVNPEIPLTQEHKNTEKKPLTSGKEYSISQTLTESVAEAAQTLLKICAFVVFFKTLTAVFLRFTASFPYLANINNNTVSAVITAIFEFSSGVSAISTAHSPIIKHELAQLIGEDMIPRLLTVSALAWSGISVHMQTAATAISCGISMKRYYRRKLAATLIAPVFFLILTLLCKRAFARV